MKPTLKTKTEELLQEKEKQLAIVNQQYEGLKEDQEKEQKRAKDIISFKKIKIDKEIASNYSSQQELRLFITDLKVLLSGE